MTKGEILCLYNIVLILDDENIVKYKYIEILKNVCEQYEREDIVSSNISIYELIMTYVASFFGNIGNYYKSDNINKKVIRECLKSRRSNMLSMNIHSLMFNNQKRIEGEIPVSKNLDKTDYLNKCIVFSKISKEEFYEKMYINELKTYLSNEKHRDFYVL